VLWSQHPPPVGTVEEAGNQCRIFLLCGEDSGAQFPASCSSLCVKYGLNFSPFAKMLFLPNAHEHF
jgi:hypothetical protein